MTRADWNPGGDASAPSRPVPVAGLGASVTIRRGVLMSEVTIVDDGEADPRRGRIGRSSPLARALEGARRGDVVELEEGGRIEEIAVFAVSCPDRPPPW